LIQGFPFNSLFLGLLKGIFFARIFRYSEYQDARFILNFQLEELTMRKVTEIEDATLVTWLHLRGHEFTPFKRADNRVVFKVEGDVSESLKAYFNNAHVGVLDYVKAYKAIRSSIFVLKAEHK
jgi:hypothetical protein